MLTAQYKATEQLMITRNTKIKRQAAVFLHKKYLTPQMADLLHTLWSNF